MPPAIVAANVVAFFAVPAFAADPQFDGAQMGLVWTVPFVGLLLSIALLPLLMPHFWHRHFGKVAAFWSLAILAPFAGVHGWDAALGALAHTMLTEYVPFVILLLALFTVAGGVRVTGSLAATPLANTGILALGTVLASWMGTTGAAMLLIRPLIRANAWRTHKKHVVIFFIFLVANVGGALTPLGDPPLFLGFLNGVGFFWPTTHLLAPMAFVAGTLLASFLVFDSLLMRREAGTRPDKIADEKLGIEGGVNLLLLIGVVGAVLLSGFWRPGVSFVVLGAGLELQNLARDALLLGLALLSWRLTGRESRVANGFSWFPMFEVAKLFAGIFVTIVPAIAILKAGPDGALASVVAVVTDDAGRPNDAAYFWATGLLSSFLDNAPTYLVFFTSAGGDAAELTGPLASTLVAISAGAVFMGANTYIGNAPNFMVRAIAVERGIAMPSFFGYMAWSGAILMPVFVVATWIFFL